MSDIIVFLLDFNHFRTVCITDHLAKCSWNLIGVHCPLLLHFSVSLSLLKFIHLMILTCSYHNVFLSLFLFFFISAKVMFSMFLEPSDQENIALSNVWQNRPYSEHQERGFVASKSEQKRAWEAVWDIFF